jgi:hypothetical protein
MKAIINQMAIGKEAKWQERKMATGKMARKQ